MKRPRKPSPATGPAHKPGRDLVVYCITNTVNGKQYVGISVKGTAHRWRGHVNGARNGGQCPLQCAIRKHGPASFTIRILQRCASNAELKAAEMRWIAKLDSYRHGYNATLGGDGALGAKRSPELRDKLSKIARKLAQTPQWKAAAARGYEKRRLNPEWWVNCHGPRYREGVARAYRRARQNGTKVKPPAHANMVRNQTALAYKQLVLPEKKIVVWYQAGMSLCAIARKVGTGTRPNSKIPRISRIRSLLVRAGVYKKPSR